jgi:uncharacterized protein (DUF885 family)
MTQTLRLCADYIDRLAVLDPVHASMLGIGGDHDAATDYSPDGHAARADLIRTTLAELGRLPVTSEADRRAADHLRERLQAEQAWHASGEPLRLLRAPYGVVSWVHDSVELLPRLDDEQSRCVANRLAAVPSMLASWRASLATGLQRGLPAARRQALESAVQAERYSGDTSHRLVAAYGEGPLVGQTQYVVGHDAYRGWLQDRHDRAIHELHGTHFDIAAPLRVVEVTLEPDSTSGSAYYTAPSEDLTRPGRTWWPTAGRERFATWKELTVVFHEGVPGHHLEIGATRVAGERLSRFAKFCGAPGHGEGWALYAERLADELGWFDIPGSRLGMLSEAALRAARVVLDIGIHLDLPLPDGSRWTFESACQFLAERGRAEPHQVHPEVVRYLGWPAQAISYKLGERAWLAARAAARRRPGFDLKHWHTAALDLGPIALDGLAQALSDR